MDINQMVDDIFEQDQPKKKINDLRSLPSYNMNDFQEDEFDITYRTPKDITEADLLPTEWEEHKIGETNRSGDRYGIDIRGSHDPILKTIGVVEDKYFIEHPKPSKNQVLVHENTHFNFQRKRDSLLEKLENSNIPAITSEANAPIWDIPKKEMDEYLDIFGNKIDKKIGWKSIVQGMVGKKPEELFAIYTSKFPEDIINPPNKLARKINRTWFD